MSKRGKKGVRQARHQQLGVINPHAGGLDIGSEMHYAALPPKDGEQAVQTFGCTTPELIRMAHWFTEHGVVSVAMECTGVYWVPVAHVLEEHGLEARLVDARNVRHVPGRKTDVQDCQWLQELHAHGLLEGAFRPAGEMEPVRTLWRQRAQLVAAGAQKILEMQKALECMNLQLHKAISDIGGLTGMSILRAIVAGERSAKVLAAMRHPNCKSAQEDIEAALTGNWREDQLFLLGQALAAYDFFHTQINDCDTKLNAFVGRLAPKERSDGPGTSGKQNRRRRNAPNAHIIDLHQELIRITGVDLTKIEGIDASTAFTIISEQGVDMSRFPSEKHFCSHLRLCPANNISGGKRLTRRLRRTQGRAAKALRIAAQALGRSDTALGAFYRRLKFSKGAGKAITATAHKLAKRIYRMLKHGEDYVLQGAETYEQKFQEHRLRHLLKQATKLGYELLDLETGEVLQCSVS